MCKKRTGMSVCPMCVIVARFPSLIFPGGLFGSSLSVPSWGSVWHWGKIHTKRRWNLLTRQPSQGWATGPWRNPACPPLGLFVTCSPSGLCNSAPAREKQWKKHETYEKYLLWKCKSGLQKSLPVQIEVALCQSPPPGASSWRDQRGTWLFC